MAEQDQIDTVEYYKILRSQFEYVNNEINNRMIWLTISQSFFYSAYAVIVNAPKENKNPIFAHMQDILIWILPVAALAACIFSYLGVIATILEMPKINKHFKEFSANTNDNQQLPPLQEDGMAFFIRLSSPVILPLVFLGTWAYIFVSQILAF